ncbi:MFS transporter [Actinomadura kijaniata]|uniref:MFS transporter n=1 Tax=Actinomadura kijaniata TaxID=46161 RepID=UPI003F19DD7E
MRVPLLALAMGTFAIGVDAFVTAGLVVPVARDLNVSEAAAGQLVTVFAVAYAVLSPVLATLTGRWTRKQVLVTAMALFVLGNVVTALAASYALVLASRVIAAAGAASFTPNASAVAAATAPPERRGRAMATVVGGLTTSTALGVPLGTWIGGAMSWRATLWLVAGLGTVALAGVLLAVPDVRTPAAGGLARRLAPLRDGQVVLALSLIMLMFGGFFVVYTYLGPVLAPATGGDAGRLAVALGVYGVMTVVGNAVGGRLADALEPQRVRVVALAALVVLMAVAPLARLTFPGALVWIALLALPGWLQYASHLRILVETAPRSAPLLLSLNASAQYLAMGLSGAVGGLALNAWGPGGLPWIGVALTAGAAATAVLAFRRRPVPALAEPAAP